MYKKIISTVSLVAILIITAVTFSSQAEAQNIGSLQRVVTPGFSFTMDMRLGDTDTDVKELQKVLNSSADTTVALDGSGSLGKETTYFGNLTKEAVIKFQTKHRESILTPYGLNQGDGVVNKATRTKLNLLIGVINTYDSVGSPQSRATASAPVVSAPPPTQTVSHAENCQFVELLIVIQAIEPHNANPARAALSCPLGQTGAPFVDIKVNGQDGPITVAPSSFVTLSWTSGGVVSCFGGSLSRPLSGNEGVSIGTTDITFDLTCRTSSGQSVADAVLVKISGTANLSSTTPLLLSTTNFVFGSDTAVYKIDTSPATKAYITHRTNSTDTKTTSFETLRTTRTETITGLRPNTLYYTKIKIVDADGNSYTSNESQVYTLSATATSSVATSTSNLKQKVLYSSDGLGVVAIPGSESLKTNSRVTLEAWVKPTAWNTVLGMSRTKDSFIISKGNIGGNVDYALSLDQGKLVYSNNDAALWTCAPVVPLNQWTHVAVSIDEMTQSINLYVNGNKMGAATSTATTTSATATSTQGVSSAICEGPRGVSIRSAKINKNNAITNEITSYITQPTTPSYYSTYATSSLPTSGGYVDPSIFSGSYAPPTSRPTSNIYISNVYPKSCSLSQTKGNGFIGSIDNVKIWNVARTADQIRASMSTTTATSTGANVSGSLLPAQLESLIGNWTFDDGFASDLSIYSNTGEVKGTSEVIEDTTAKSPIAGSNYSFGQSFSFADACDAPKPKPVEKPVEEEEAVKESFSGYAKKIEECTPKHSFSGKLWQVEIASCVEGGSLNQNENGYIVIREGMQPKPNVGDTLLGQVVKDGALECKNAIASPYVGTVTGQLNPQPPTGACKPAEKAKKDHEWYEISEW